MSAPTTNRQRALAVLRYEEYDRLPIVHFGFWAGKTLGKWAAEGHVSHEEARDWRDGNATDLALGARLGFDFNWQNVLHPNSGLAPGFKSEVVREFPDGSSHVRNAAGVTLLHKPGAGSIPAEIDHLLKDRASWEERYKSRYVWSEERVANARIPTPNGPLVYGEGGREYLLADEWENPLGLHCGSLYGQIRNVLGVENACYMLAEDPDLLCEIVDAVGEICYRNTAAILESGARFDFAHFWEDICYRQGPLVSPAFFAEKVGPHYKRITDLLTAHGIDIVSLDCDGMIDHLVPIWYENGVNTMFPIEVGVWDASIGPWREKYGRGLLGVGGMNKTVFAHDRAAVDAEIEGLKPLVGLGGYIPCPDHRLATDAKYDLVRYYCERMRAEFS